MGRFLLGATVGAAGGVMLVGMVLAKVWLDGNWEAYAHDADAMWARQTGRPRQLVSESNMEAYVSALRGL